MLILFWFRPPTELHHLSLELMTSSTVKPEVCHVFKSNLGPVKTSVPGS